MERNSFLIVAKEVLADKRLSATEKLILAQLLDHRNRKTGQCNPKQAKLAAELGMGVATVERGLAALRRVGLITVKRRQTCCHYEIQIPHFEGSRSLTLRGQIPHSDGLGVPGPLYEPDIKNLRGVAASSSNKKSSNGPRPARKSAQSETLEAYYREERRKAGK
jgi:DNA-binding transcriptional MocR family regulator